MVSNFSPEGPSSLLDQDFYKLTMQCAVLKFFPSVMVEYRFSNRTSHLRLNRKAFIWLQAQVAGLEKLELTDQEFDYLRGQCKFFPMEYLAFLRAFRFRPTQQVTMSFSTVEDEYGDVSMTIHGPWTETILYETMILQLTSAAYFKFCDQDWNHEGQEEKAYQKGLKLLESGCIFSEFGSRRRRDFETHDLVLKGLVKAAQTKNLPGKFTGTSNVYLAMKHGVPPVGTVAHEWYMAIAAITDDYKNANELGLEYWLKCYGEGVLGIALTDTFGTPAFFKAFNKSIPGNTPVPWKESERSNKHGYEDHTQRSYAETFVGIRQDSGDPKDYIVLAKDFYESIGVKGKSIMFTDALNVDRCIEYKTLAEKHGFKPAFGIGTSFTNDFTMLSDGKTKSTPLNIVIKVSKANGNPAIKISDNVGKNTGDIETVQRVKSTLGYAEHNWKGGDETRRW